MNIELRPKVGVSVLLAKNKHILLGKRKTGHGAGTWGFPGGNVEFKETITSCAIREVKEETDIKLNDLHYLGFTNDIFSKDNLHYITFFMFARLTEYDIVKALELEKCANWVFYPQAKLPEPLFLPVENFFNDAYCNKNLKLLMKLK